MFEFLKTMELLSFLMIYIVTLILIRDFINNKKGKVMFNKECVFVSS